MNRYPVWVYVTVAVALVLGLLYTLPNFFGEAPAVQVSSARATVRVDASLLDRVEGALKQANVPVAGSILDANSVKVRLENEEAQLKARDILERDLNPDKNDPGYTVALNLLSRSPGWLRAIHALPMYLGLDLRGGVHFLFEVDMKEALVKRLDGYAGEIRSQLRGASIRHNGVSREGNAVVIRFRDADTRTKARARITSDNPDLVVTDTGSGDDLRLSAAIRPEAEKRIQDFALKQNITTLNRRINELGVAEPVIQQQGADRIVVQLPGVQDTSQAKRVLGRTATLELRMVDEENMTPSALADAKRGNVPLGSEYYEERNGQPIMVKKRVELTGERLTDAQPGFDGQTNEPAVHLTLDSTGSRTFKELTRENVGKRMAILLFERGKGEVITAPVIRTEIGGGRVQISGRMTTQEANETALLLRAGSLAAPMQIIEERTVGPSLGRENIEKGFQSTMWGFIAIVAFMCVYYAAFGLFSSVALAGNLLFLVAVLSLLQATLTLPGIAAIALTLGMAIDANVLINERIREETRNGKGAFAALDAGFDRAYATIIDSYVTHLIAVALLFLFGSGPVRGFAITLGIGVVTTLFTAVSVVRVIMVLYVRRVRPKQLAI